jgi:hypothetical protein
VAVPKDPAPPTTKPNVAMTTGQIFFFTTRS